jgi:N-acylneuraminate cytidylyltransferase
MGEVVAIIPARGGSKGIPRKNLQPLRGVALVARAIRAAKRAKLIERVALTTDDDEIAALGVSEGADIVRRPAELSDDAAPTLPAVLHAIATMGSVDIVVVLEPTSPFRRPREIDACVEKLREPDTQSVVTVVQQERNPFNLFSVDGDRAIRFIEKPATTFTSRHQFAQLKRINGCVYATWAANVRAGHLVVAPIRVVEMSQETSVNIDTPLDFALAELVAERFDLEDGVHS